MSTLIRPPQEHMESPTASPRFTEAQRLHFRVGCESIDKLLREIETVLDSGDVASPFRQYLMDISPAQGHVVEDYIRRLRAQLLRALAWQGIEPSPPTIPATRAIKVRLHFVDIGLSDLRPKEMRGSGALSEATAAELTGVLGELSSIVGEMMAYLSYDLNESLEDRVQRLEARGQELLLGRVEQVITRRGLVEFRPRFELLLSGLESAAFEVAVFGRVSSGKSSFLNALLETDLLPVGVNPITAVPTRIQFGENIRARVRLRTGVLSEVSPARLRELITEAGNSGNQEGVREAILETPASRLRTGTVLVDTPGLGSLALQGSKETLAYLPSCDLALVLIDAGNTLTPEDIGTLRLLQEAGITAMVLLSKADLVKPSELPAAVEYVTGQIERELRKTLSVYPISSLPACVSMINDFYLKELEVRFKQARELKEQSIRSKLLRLRDDLLATLNAKAERLANASWVEAGTLHDLEGRLLGISTSLGALDRTVEDRVASLGASGSAVLSRIIQEVAAHAVTTKATSVQLSAIVNLAQHIVQSEVAELVSTIQQRTQEVVAIVRDVGGALKSSDLPEEYQLLRIVRNAPRFELAACTGAVNVGAWRLLGQAAVRGRLSKAIRPKIGTLLQSELSAYGHTLEAWTKRVLRDVRFGIDSFANVYRASLQQAVGLENPEHEAALIRADIDYLRASD